MLDRLAELAALMDDDADEMVRFRQVRLGFEHAPAERFCLHQPALGTAAVGVDERLGDWHEGRVALCLVHGRP